MAAIFLLFTAGPPQTSDPFSPPRHAPFAVAIGGARNAASGGRMTG
jgi:hypothetical protein